MRYEDEKKGSVEKATDEMVLFTFQSSSACVIYWRGR
jgi:hypothetical protein